jgi:hypothetical protein
VESVSRAFAMEVWWAPSVNTASSSKSGLKTRTIPESSEH